MQVLKDEVRERIYHSGVNVFLKKGYLKATVKDIAQDAGVPVGLMYSYYQNKEALFDAIVRPVYTTLIHFFEDPAQHETGIDIFFDKKIPTILNLVNEKRKEIVVLIDKSTGTKYEESKSVLVDFITKLIKHMFNEKKSQSAILIDDFFYHILANNFAEGVFEVARHYKNREWAKTVIYLLARQHMYGVAGM
jgi:AcrR family transcriptional regulator